MKKIVVFTAVLGLMLGVVGVQAQSKDLPSAGITPNSSFFFLTQFFEGVGTFFAFGDSAKAKNYLDRAEKRLAEIVVMAEQGNDGLAKGVALYEKHFSKSMEKAGEANNEDVNARVAEAAGKHLTILEGVLERVPEQAKDAIQRALESSKKGRDNALDALSNQNPERALEIGNEMFQNRVKSAQEKAELGEYEELDIILQDVEQLRVKLDEVAQESDDLKVSFSDELTAAISGLNTALSSLPEDAPDEAIENIQAAKSAVIENQLNALREVLENKPEEVAGVFERASRTRIDEVRNSVDSNRVGESLDDFQKYAALGEEMALFAQTLQDGGSVEELVARATSHHLTVLRDVQDKLPAQALDNFQKAVRDTERVDNMLPDNIPQRR